jgi:hypothetical protein
MMTKQQKVSCTELAMARAVNDRKRMRSGIGSPLRGEILGAVMGVSSFMVNSIVLIASSIGRGRPVIVTPEEASTVRARRRRIEISDYERGVPCPLRRRDVGHGRYHVSPSLWRLVKDLRRPSARWDALAALVSRISDEEVRAWVVDRVHACDLNRLAIHVRPGTTEETAMAGWRAELDADLAASADDTSEGPSNGSSAPRGSRPQNG